MDWWTSLVKGIVRDGCFWMAVWLGLFGAVLCMRRDRADERIEHLMGQPTCLGCRWPIDLCDCPMSRPERQQPEKKVVH